MHRALVHSAVAIYKQTMDLVGLVTVMVYQYQVTGLNIHHRNLVIASVVGKVIAIIQHVYTCLLTTLALQLITVSNLQ